MSERLRAVSILPGATLRQALAAIDRGACEIALVVDDGGRLLGTLTDGDVRRALLAGAALEDQVGVFAHREFTVVGTRAGRAEVLDLMRARALEQIPILDADGRLVGLHLLREMIGAVARANWAVIMAGGRGERLRPVTDAIPKPMIPVAGRPILERIVLHLVGYGVRRIFISVNYRGEVIERHFGDGAAFGCQIQYLREDRPLGTGGALSLLPEAPTEPLLVLNGDLVTQFDVGQMLDFHSAGAHRATVGLHDYVHTVPYGVVRLDGDRLVGLEEKPAHSWLTNAGVYLLEPDLLGRVPCGEAYLMTALIADCLERGDSVGGFRIHDDWVDVGLPRDLARASGREE